MTQEEEEKICPLMTNKAAPAKCHGRKCALWIRIQKPLNNPFCKLHYEGCGLITKVPWEPVKQEEPEK